MDTFKVFYEKTNLEPNELTIGDRVEDCNSDCKHYKSKGSVTKVSKIKGKKGNIVGNKVSYRCDCDGPTWSKGDELEKTEIQLKKLKK
jgi:hypothetical protein